jgi:hypothetical protein
MKNGQGQCPQRTYLSNAIGERDNGNCLLVCGEDRGENSNFFFRLDAFTVDPTAFLPAPPTF